MLCTTITNAVISDAANGVDRILKEKGINSLIRSNKEDPTEYSYNDKYFSHKHMDNGNLLIYPLFHTDEYDQLIEERSTT